MKLTRRGFIGTSAATGTALAAPQVMGAGLPDQSP
ncbi:MAG: twin-arginine translocation signal domain-containing protein [Pseudomonadota bacterium]